MTDQEKHFARFYSGGQVVMFARDNAGLGIAAGAEYRVSGLARAARDRQIVRLVAVTVRPILWIPRIGRAPQGIESSACRERGCQYGWLSVRALIRKKITYS